MKNEQPSIVFPFTSDKFMEAWEMWKQYKKETFGFVYKGLYSEQMTLRKLTELSGGDEERSIRIIEQSIMQQWRGLFALHIPKFNENGERVTKKPIADTKQQSGTLRERVQAELDKRNGNGQQQRSSHNTEGI